MPKEMRLQVSQPGVLSRPLVARAPAPKPSRSISRIRSTTPSYASRSPGSSLARGECCRRRPLPRYGCRRTLSVMCRPRPRHQARATRDRAGRDRTMTTLIEPTTSARLTATSAPASPAPARSTPSTRTARDASIDVARAWCLVVVVTLHSFMVGVSVAGGAPLLENATDGWGGFAALTWFVQIMPLFFVLGGFSSVTQWSRLRTRGVSASDYLALRMRRLLPPALGAMGVTAVVLLVLSLSGVPADMVAVAGFRMSQPLWFLGVYLLCTALVPLATRAHRAAPRLTVLTLAAVVVGVDAARLASGIEALGFANLLFVWLLLQQLGFHLADGRVSTDRRTLLTLAGLALGGLAALCLNGIYSFDLYDNLNPP